MKIRAFDSHLTFAPVYENGPVVPGGVDMEVKGRAYLLAKIEEKESIRYSNFERVVN